MPSLTLPYNRACGLTVAAKLIFSCIGLCSKSSSGCSCEISCKTHRKKKIPVKCKCSESNLVCCRVVAGYLSYSIADGALKDPSTTYMLINSLSSY